MSQHCVKYQGSFRGVVFFCRSMNSLSQVVYIRTLQDLYVIFAALRKCPVGAIILLKPFYTLGAQFTAVHPPDHFVMKLAPTISRRQRITNRIHSIGRLHKSADLLALHNFVRFSCQLWELMFSARYNYSLFHFIIHILVMTNCIWTKLAFASLCVNNFMMLTVSSAEGALCVFAPCH